MAAYIARRLIWVVFLLFAITLITFFIFSVLPAGDPAVARAGRQPSAELIAAIREQLGLDKPKPVQFINYIGDILPFFGGNGVYFGFSYQNNTDVLPEILERLPTTIFLTTGAALLWLAIGIPIGIISAIRTGSLLDRLSMGVALLFISAPVPFLGLLALYLFADDIGVWPILPGNSAYNDATSFPEKAEAPDPAVVRARRPPGGDLRARHPQQPARHPRRGLHPHRPREGAPSAHRDPPPRPAGEPHADRDDARPRHRAPVGGAVITESIFNIPGIGATCSTPSASRTCR